MVAQYLPAFVTAFLGSLITDKCVESLLINYDFRGENPVKKKKKKKKENPNLTFLGIHVVDAACLNTAFSKVLSLGLVAGGALVKLPQILKIIQQGSAQVSQVHSLLRG